MELSEEILKQRKTGIGGSDCAAVLGLSRFDTPLDIYLSKISNEISTKEDTPVMKLGRRLEPDVINDYIDETSNKVIMPNKIFHNEKYPWLLANVDGLVEDKKIIVEAKTTGFFNEEWGIQETDQIPIEYYMQVAHYCIVLDYDRADIAAMSRVTGELRIYHYERNEAIEKKLIERTKLFWENNVLKLIPPQLTAQDDVYKIYKKSMAGKTLIADENLSKLAYRHIDIKNSIKNLQAECDLVENEIKNNMKDAEFLIEPDGTKLIAWANSSRNNFNTKEFKKDHAELYKNYSSVSEGRRFCNKIKNKEDTNDIS